MFFPYHPRKMRRYLALAAGGCAIVAAWALAGYSKGTENLALARAGVCLGLLLAILVLHFRLRPRSGWGVQISPTALTIARPFSGQHLLPWSDVREIRRSRGRAQHLAVVLSDEHRLLLPDHLFASRSEFEALSRALEDRSPTRHFQA